MINSSGVDLARKLTQEILEDAVIEGSIEAVREATSELVETHLIEVSQYDIIQDLVAEEIDEQGYISLKINPSVSETTEEIPPGDTTVREIPPNLLRSAFVIGS